MKEELDIKLFKSFPNLYRGVNKPITENLMSLGFECSDGWFKLIWDLSEKLEKIILELPEKDRERFCAVQVKTKFAGLRFYMDAQTEEMSKLIDEAENLSYEICEYCGEKGKLYDDGWMTTLCEKCQKEVEDEKEKRKND